MNNLAIFNNEIFGQVRFMEIDNKMYAVANDVAKSLGYSDCPKAVRTHCKGVDKMAIPTKGGEQIVKIIPEGDIYRLIVRSNKPEAEVFESWVFDEVIPTLRQNKIYATNDVTDEHQEAFSKYGTPSNRCKTFIEAPVENIRRVYDECMKYNSKKSTSEKLSIMNCAVKAFTERKEKAYSNNQVALASMLSDEIIKIQKDISEKNNRSRGGKLSAKTKKINALMAENEQLKMETRSLEEDNEALKIRNHQLDPKDEEFMKIRMHGFSENRMFETLVDSDDRVMRDHKGLERKKKTFRYAEWRNEFSQKFKAGNYGLDLKAGVHYDIFLYFDFKTGHDVQNMQKSFLDALADEFGIDDNKFHLMRCDHNREVSRYEDGNIYFCVRERNYAY